MKNVTKKTAVRLSVAGFTSCAVFFIAQLFFLAPIYSCVGNNDVNWSCANLHTVHGLVVACQVLAVLGLALGVAGIVSMNDKQRPPR